ncbi:hypothetical protein ILUMI_22987 [Ignelater luminosus]|uniref:THAP-type domain-containing protein n=1 Tax=Ignelater luminosus TaxID=2038154 RepID=A0A8K0CDA3_IGNLU|nr:hypothetical protein ILUMI_22987 [Ignelater luminosus]
MNKGEKRICFLCNSKTSQSYHKFPKSESLRSLWLQACNLTPEDNVNSLKICSKHFKEDDFVDLNARRFGGIIRLKTNAVPSPSVIECNVTVAKPVSEFSKELNMPSTSTAHEMKICSNVVHPSTCTNEEIMSNNEQEMILETEVQRTPTKRKHVLTPWYVGDLSDLDVTTSRKAKRSLQMAQATITKQRKKIKSLQQQRRRLTLKIRCLKDLVASVPEHVQEIIKRNLRNKKQQYSSELRQFALTLQYYSPRAYNYIRHKWRNLLPHSSTIKNWYSNINCKPGFQKQALDAIANENKKKKVLLNIVIDEIAIRSQIIYGSNRFYGGVDLGSHMSFESDNDNLPKATHALVFMAVAINGSFKVPIAYFLIKSLTGEERANLLSKCLELINDTGAKAVSIVFDGAPTNLVF